MLRSYVVILRGYEGREWAIRCYKIDLNSLDLKQNDDIIFIQLQFANSKVETCNLHALKIDCIFIIIEWETR